MVDQSAPISLPTYTLIVSRGLISSHSVLSQYGCKPRYFSTIMDWKVVPGVSLYQLLFLITQGPPRSRCMILLESPATSHNRVVIQSWNKVLELLNGIGTIWAKLKAVPAAKSHMESPGSVSRLVFHLFLPICRLPSPPPTNPFN